MEFYSLKHRRSIDVPDRDVRKRVLTRATSKGQQERYMLEATITIDGAAASLHKFVSKSTFDAFGSEQ